MRRLQALRTAGENESQGLCVVKSYAGRDELFIMRAAAGHEP